MAKKLEVAVAAVTTDNRKAIAYAGEVFVPPIFQGERIYRFKILEINLLRALGETQNLEESALKCEITPAQATSILKRKHVRDFLESRLQEIAVHRGWSIEKWFNEGHRVWTGEKKISREQAEVWKEFGNRVAPKTERIQVESSDEEFVFTVRAAK